MDIFDRATQKEERDRDDAIAAQRARAPRGESAKWCEGPACGARIPEARRRAVPGVRYCVECQERMERGGRR